MLCPDWVFVNNANVHVAKDRGWFSDYRTITSQLTSWVIGDGQQVVGIGTVELAVKRTPGLTGPKPRHGTLRLENVLHVPSSICNIIGNCLPPGYNFSLHKTDESIGNITDEKGVQLAYFTAPPSSGLFHVRLSGPPVGPKVGPSQFREGGRYAISASWPESERRKWVLGEDPSDSSEVEIGNAPFNFEDEGDEEVDEDHGVHTCDRAPLNEEEERYLKEKVGSEAILLGRWALDINNKEDRETGRYLLRMMMQHDSMSAEEEAGHDSETSIIIDVPDHLGSSLLGPKDSPVGSKRKRGDSPTSGEAKRRDARSRSPEIRTLGQHAYQTWTEKEAEYMKTKFGGEWRFLRQFGLKIYNQEDRDEGRRLIASFIEDDKERERMEREKITSDKEEGANCNIWGKKERDYMRSHFGSEFKLLQRYGWKVRRLEDWVEGKEFARQVVRGMMWQDEHPPQSDDA